MSNKNTQFKTGWIGIKKCIKCDQEYTTTSGSQKKCSDCRKCEYCNKNLKYSHKRFCNNSCSGKWKYKNCSKVKEVIEKGREKAYTPEIRQKLIDFNTGRPKYNMRGDKNPNWNGGTYRNERHTLMGRIEYRNWRRQIFIRDNYTCQICYVRGGELNADHIIPYYADKSKALDLDNGRTLCVKCHRKTDTYGTKVKRYIKESNK